MMNERKKRKGKGAIIVAIIALLLISGMSYYFIQEIDKLTLKPPSTATSEQLSKWQNQAQEFEERYTKKKKSIQELMKTLPEKSDDWRLKNQLVIQIEENILELKTLANEIGHYRDSSDFDRIKIRMSLAEMQLDNFKEANELAGDFVIRFNQLDGLQKKVDSLTTLIGKYKGQVANQISSSGKSQFQAQISRLTAEKNSYEEQMALLKATSLKLERERDSLQIALNKADTTIDTLLISMADKLKETNRLKQAAATNSELATNMDLWYFEKDKTRKPRRRYLVGDKQDYNRGSEIKSIHGVFSISYEIFKPFQVANVQLVKTDGTREELGEAKMTVRNQKSSEFNIITDGGLDRGDYTVEVLYEGKKVLEQIFYVTN